MHSALVANHQGILNQENVVFCVGNGFIRSETSDDHRGSLNGISYAFFASFPIQSTDLKQKEDGMHKCIPYANNNIF